MAESCSTVACSRREKCFHCARRLSGGCSWASRSDNEMTIVSVVSESESDERFEVEVLCGPTAGVYSKYNLRLKAG